MFEQVIVKRPAKSLVHGITSNPELGAPNYEKALKQHDNYIKALEKCGVSVHILEADEEFPDSCFVEDVAVCTKHFVMITSPGAETRKGEEESMISELKKFYTGIEYIQKPGTLEGGDVMMVNDHFFIGLSERTNKEGARQLICALESHGLSGSVVELNGMLHLKTGLAYLENNTLLISGEFLSNRDFDKFEKIIIDEDEGYAANCIRINDFVIMPEGYPKAKKKIAESGFSIIEVDTSEYKKIDGGLSCLSLRF